MPNIFISYRHSDSQDEGQGDNDNGRIPHSFEGRGICCFRTLCNWVGYSDRGACTWKNTINGPAHAGLPMERAANGTPAQSHQVGWDHDGGVWGCLGYSLVGLVLALRSQWLDGRPGGTPATRRFL
jgi:hypothetical protein